MAIRNTLSRGTALPALLTRIQDDEQLEIDDNAAERWHLEEGSVVTIVAPDGEASFVASPAVRFSVRAADEIEVADRWWKRNRPAAAGAITEELQRALELITRQPSAGVARKRSRASLRFGTARENPGTRASKPRHPRVRNDRAAGEHGRSRVRGYASGRAGTADRRDARRLRGVPRHVAQSARRHRA